MDDHLANVVTDDRQDDSTERALVERLRRLPLPLLLGGVVLLLGLAALLLVRFMAYLVWADGVPLVVRAGLVAALAQIGFSTTRQMVETHQSH